MHGDYRLDNVLVDEHDVPIPPSLDWEMATLGDPSLTWRCCVMYHRIGHVAANSSVADVSSARRASSTGERAHRALRRGSGQDLAGLGWHLGLAAYKLAAILEGIHYRFLHGQTVGAGFDSIGEGVPALLDTGLNALKENS